MERRDTPSPTISTRLQSRSGEVVIALILTLAAGVALIATLSSRDRVVSADPAPPQVQPIKN